jgi:hypothetical protein
MARSSECTDQYAQKVFDNADIVRDAILQQLRDTTLSVAQKGNLKPSGPQ